MYDTPYCYDKYVFQNVFSLFVQCISNIKFKLALIIVHYFAQTFLHDRRFIMFCFVFPIDLIYDSRRLLSFKEIFANIVDTNK